ncbi:FAD-dependent oxidoreductase [Verrucomicrobiaceae bacterium R5-34]|nr:FAD-dependent oxidoreductase [Verrucomicrobiaceae bacterium R5-34]
MVASKQDDVDLVVIGGGSAGICAAVAAARRGARVVLLEKSPLLGGMGSLAFVHTFCGLYMPDVSQAPELANPGLPTEIERRMRAATGQSGPVKMGRVYVLPQQPEVYDRIAKELVAEAGVELCLGASCEGVSRTDSGFSVALRDRRIHCRSLVDGSADAVVADFLGATRVQVAAERLQRPAFIFSLSRVGAEAAEESFRMRLALDLVHAVREGKLPKEILGATLRASPTAGEYFVSIDLAGDDWNPTDASSREVTTTAGKKLAIELCAFLRQHYAFFSQAGPPVFPPALGVRESYRWLGQHELSEQELIDGVDFADTVARATWPIELREDARGAKFRYFAEAKPSNIPLRALVSAEIPGVYFAGRCLSASHEALASVRVMGTCFATGQAAGLAAAMFAQGITEVSEQAAEIRRHLGLD